MLSTTEAAPVDRSLRLHGIVHGRVGLHGAQQSTQLRVGLLELRTSDIESSFSLGMCSAEVEGEWMGGSVGGRWLDTSVWFLYFWGMGGWNISEFAGGGE